MEKYHSKWEAKVLEETIVASGTWYYQNEISYNAKLIKQIWNYTSADLPELDKILEVPYCDYIDYKISDEGVLYHWVFSNASGETYSPSFSSYFMARDHINTYGYKYKIEW